MNTINLEIHLDMSTAAFREDGDDGRTEAAWVLRKIGRAIGLGQDAGAATDSNGNTVGRWWLRGLADPQEIDGAAARGDETWQTGHGINY